MRVLNRIIERLTRARSATPGDLQLDRRNIYVLPTRAGLLYAVALATMLLASINDGLTLGHLLTFVLAALAIVGILHAFRNLSALALKPGRAPPVFAGQPASIGLSLVERRGLARFALTLSSTGTAEPVCVDVPAFATLPVSLTVATRRRGWMPVPRITIATRFPLGLWRAWSWWLPPMRVLVYPAPEQPGVPLLPAGGDDESGSTTSIGAGQDVAGIRPWREGDPSSRLAWRAMARSGTDTLLSRQFDGDAQGEWQLDWNALPSTLDIEARLSRLTRWVLDAEAAGARWTLALPHASIGPGSDASHRERCLSALAEFDNG